MLLARFKASLTPPRLRDAASAHRTKSSDFRQQNNNHCTGQSGLQEYFIQLPIATTAYFAWYFKCTQESA